MGDCSAHESDYFKFKGPCQTNGFDNQNKISSFDKMNNEYVLNRFEDE